MSMLLTLTVSEGGRIQAMTSVEYPSTQEKMDAAKKVLADQISGTTSVVKPKSDKLTRGGLDIGERCV